MSLHPMFAPIAPEPRTQTHAPPVERLLVAMHDLSLARDLARIQAIVREAARDLAQADGATFVLRERGDAGDRCFYADEDAIGPLWKGRRFPAHACISGWAMRHGRAAVVPDIRDDPRIPLEAYAPTFVKSLVVVPIRRADPIGAIGCYWSVPRAPTWRDVEALQALADATSVVMEHVATRAELERRVQERTAELADARRELAEARRELAELARRRAG